MKLKGMTWSHDRGVKPLLAASKKFNEIHPDVEIEWDARSLADFEIFPLDQLASEYDFIMIDHPHIGTAYAQNLLVPLDTLLGADFIKDQEENSVGLSHQSYQWEGHQWAIAADCAAQFSAYRKDIMEQMDAVIPGTWDQVYSLAKSLPKGMKMAIPFVPIHAYSSFFSLCSQVTDQLFWSNGQALQTEVGVKALKILRNVLDLSHEGSYDMDPINALDLMSKEDAIAYIPLTYGYSTYSEQGYNKHRVKFDDMPSDTGKPNGSMIGGVGLSISSKCKAPEVAAEFIKMTCSADFQKTDFVDNFGQPGYRGAWTDERVNDLSYGFYEDTLDTMDYGSMRPRFNGYIEFQEKAGKMIRQFFMDNQSEFSTFVDALNALFMTHYNKREEA